MICLAVFEPDQGRKARIKDWLVRYTIQRNCELELLWFVDQDPVAQIGNHAEKIQIALVSLDAEKGMEIGQVLYEMNPDCRIVYYRTGKCDLEALLATRPISFWLWESGAEAFMEKLDAVYQDVRLNRATFCYETKSKLYLLPKRNILYFQSDLRYVNICLLHGESPRILAKLSEMERLTGDSFVRIHKSYLVNPKHVLRLDKKNRLVVLCNGEQLPVSEAQYEKACGKLRAVR